MQNCQCCILQHLANFKLRARDYIPLCLSVHLSVGPLFTFLSIKSFQVISSHSKSFKVCKPRTRLIDVGLVGNV